MMGDPSLTVVFTHSGTPTSVDVDVVHPPLEVVHGVRVSPIRAAGVGPVASLALPLFLDALCLLLFFTFSIFFIFLPTNQPRGSIRKCRSWAEGRSQTIPSLPFHLPVDSKMTRIPDRLIYLFIRDHRAKGWTTH